MSRYEWSKRIFGKTDSRRTSAPSPGGQSSSESRTSSRLGTVLAYDENTGYYTVQLDGSTDENGVPVPIEIRPSVPLAEGQRVSAVIGGGNVTIIPDDSSIQEVAQPLVDSAAESISADTVVGLSGLRTEMRGAVATLEADVGSTLDQVWAVVNEDGETVSQIRKNFTFGDDGLTIGQSDSPVKANLDNDGLTFTANGQDVLTLDAETSTADMSRLKMGGYRWQAVDGGEALALVYVG